VAKGTRYGPDRPYPAQELVDLVGSLGGTWHGRTAMCRCPAHADDTPSLSLRQGNRGILVTCFAGCNRDDVLRELRRAPRRGRFTYADSGGGQSGNAARLWDNAHPVEGTLAERYLRLVTSGQLLKICGFIHAAPTDPSRSRPFIPRIGRGPGGAPIDRCPAHLPRSHDSSLRDETHAGQARPRCMAG
jgi:hypothetical protein